MSVVITQTPDEIGQSISVHSKAALKRVRLIATSANSVQIDDRETIKLNCDIQHRTKTATLDAQTLATPIEFRMTLRDTDVGDEDDPFFHVEALFEAVYELDAGFEPTLDEIQSFARGNAVLNCWPFWREYVRDLAHRMEQPTPFVPFLRLMVESDPEAEIRPVDKKKTVRKKTARKKSAAAVKRTHSPSSD